MTIWTEPTVDDRVLSKIMDIGLEREPYEACGVILPDGEVREIRNCVIEPNRFYVRGEDLVEELISWAQDQEVPLDTHCECIIWHTHPNNGSVGPSRDDLQARWPGGKFLVVTLPNGEAVRY